MVSISRVSIPRCSTVGGQGWGAGVGVDVCFLGELDVDVDVDVDVRTRMKKWVKGEGVSLLAFEVAAMV